MKLLVLDTERENLEWEGIPPVADALDQEDLKRWAKTLDQGLIPHALAVLRAVSGATPAPQPTPPEPTPPQPTPPAPDSSDSTGGAEPMRISDGRPVLREFMEKHPIFAEPDPTTMEELERWKNAVEELGACMFDDGRNLIEEYFSWRTWLSRQEAKIQALERPTP